MTWGSAMFAGIRAALRPFTVGLTLALLAGQAAAQAPVVVELYTSQGCSSCPPADQVMAELAGRDDVIALALHVDYWDYLGWADKFAHARFTDRQKSYARAAGKRMIYTPQMIVAGVAAVEGYRKAEIGDLILSHSAMPTRVTLRVDRTGDTLRITARAEPPLDSGVLVQLVRYRTKETVTIEHGENAGRTETYHNIVTAWDPVAEWAGDAPLIIDATVSGKDPVVVLVQEPGPGKILAAARLR